MLSNSGVLNRVGRGPRAWGTHAIRPPRLTKLKAAVAEPSLNWDSVLSGKLLPPRFVGPVAVQDVQGKGRGLVASRPISAGELILVSKPLVYLANEEAGNLPSVEELLAKLNNGQYTQQQLSWLRAMFAGDAHSDPQPVPAMAPGWHPEEEPTGSVAPIQEADVEEALRMNVLALNMFGEEFQDLPASLVRQDTPVGHLGLWPEFSLLNHSCAPNCINFTISDRMIVRAAQNVPQGAELTINYLGRSSLRPATERLLDLRDGYGFSCACPRCSIEMDDTSAQAVEAVTSLYNAVMYELVPSLQAVLGDADNPPGEEQSRQMVTGVRAKLEPLVASMETQLAQFAGQTTDKQVLDWFRASAFEAYGLQQQLRFIEDQLQGGVAPGGGASPATSASGDVDEVMLDVASKVATASDLHLFLCVKAVARAIEAHGAESEAVAQAKARVMEVVKLRYGQDLAADTVVQLSNASAQALDRVTV